MQRQLDGRLEAATIGQRAEDLTAPRPDGAAEPGLGGTEGLPQHRVGAGRHEQLDPREEEGRVEAGPENVDRRADPVAAGWERRRLSPELLTHALGQSIDCRGDQLRLGRVVVELGTP